MHSTNNHKANYFHLITFLLLSFFMIQPLAALESSDKQKWIGTWNEFEKPPENPRVYYYYTIKLKEGGFDWTSVYRDVPYGPNELQQSGYAKFVDAFKAFDSENKQQFILTESAKGIKTITVRSLSAESGSKIFYYIPTYFKAGFNCAKASTLIEKAICTNKRLAWADREMNVEYKTAKKKLSKTDWKSVKMDQRAWFKQRGNCNKNGQLKKSCLELSYAHRLAALQKINDPQLGNGNGIDGDYLMGLYNNKVKLETSVPFLLTLASKQEQVAIDLTNNEARNLSYTVSQSGNKTILKGSYDYDSVCWPADCVIYITFTVSLKSQVIIEINKTQKSGTVQ